jgi:hypothetical protein
MWNSEIARMTGMSPRLGILTCLLAASMASNVKAPMPVRIAAVQRGGTCMTMSFVTVQLRPQAIITKAKRSSAPDFVNRDVTRSPIGAIWTSIADPFDDTEADSRGLLCNHRRSSPRPTHVRPEPLQSACRMQARARRSRLLLCAYPTRWGGKPVFPNAENRGMIIRLPLATDERARLEGPPI